GGVVPADRPPDPDLHLALLRPEGLRAGGLPELSRVEPRLHRAREHHRADEGRVGTAASRDLRREPADVVVLHGGDDAEGAANHDDGAADRLRPVHPQLPDRADDLLADHEPVDDRARRRDAADDAPTEPRRTAQELADAAE